MDYNTLLKQETLPKKLYSKDKKTNDAIEKQFYRSKIKQERQLINGLMHNFQAGYMQADEGEETLKVKQSQISDIVNIQSACNIFDLDLDLGSYRCQYSHNGSSLLLTSSMGHTSIINWRQKFSLLEINLGQYISHATFMHNDEMFALAQGSGVYIYDNWGIQLHKLDKSLGLEYLPYHFLLVGYDCRKLKYYDTTTGQIVADHVAKNPYTVMRSNPSNAVIALGSCKGTVEWWTPGVGSPAVKLFVGNSLTDIGFHKGYMYSAAEDIKVWDSRMLKVLHSYPLHRRIKSLEVSQSGVLAVNHGFRLEFFKQAHVKKQTHAYMTYNPKSNANNCRFVPFQDCMGLGTVSGFSSIIIPGSGVPFYDSFENNPFETKKQKRESLVHKLLEKLPMETITVDPNVIGNLDNTKREVLLKQQREMTAVKQRQELQKKLSKNKSRGRNSIKNRVLKKTIELQKKKREELSKTINTKLWAKWAEKKKKEKETEIINEIGERGIAIADVIRLNKKISKSNNH